MRIIVTVWITVIISLNTLGKAICQSPHNDSTYQGERANNRVEYLFKYSINKKFRIILLKKTNTNSLLSIYINKRNSWTIVKAMPIKVLATLRFIVVEKAKGNKYLLLRTGGNRRIDYKITFEPITVTKHVK